MRLHAVAGECIRGVGCGVGDVLDDGDDRLQLDGDECCPVADGHQRRDGQWQRHDRLQRGGESEYDATDRDDQRRRPDLRGDAGSGGLQHDDLADGKLADGGGWCGDGGGDSECGVVRVDGKVVSKSGRFVDAKWPR